VTRDAWLVFIAKTTRTFCYGFLGVLFPVYLTDRGLDARGLGLAVTLALVASAGLTMAVRRPAERWGPRVTLVLLAGLIVLSGILFLTVRQPWAIVVAAMVGNLAVGTGETGPFLALEQVVVARAAPRARLTSVLGQYYLIGYVAAAAGAAMVGQAGPPPSVLFMAFLGGGLVQILAYAFLRPSAPAARAAVPVAAHPSRPLVRKLAALFALDSLAGGFLLQTLVAYWFYTRWDLPLTGLGWVFFGAQLLSGLSLLLASRLALRLGLVNTMVFSHLASNVLVILLALAPTVVIAVPLLWARHLLSQMDVPTRQAFLLLAVQDHERERATSLTNTTRTLAQAISPTFTGWLMQSVALSAPFVLGGGLKIVYDLLLYVTIRRVRVG
jgi:MFS family permease